ncbi:radical SAM protein [Kaistella sp.]|uniref:radical SAM protein n=1 Tax=Kaistella sp. TaxID=2782235 RepID=UPI003C330EC3
MKKITSFVLKVASRCNLNCSYCYMYNLGDNTYLSQPKFMSIETITIFAMKLNEYCIRNDVKYLQIVFHGGEPLLWSMDNYKKSVEIFTKTIKNVTFDFALQTNGVTLDDKWCQLFKNLNIRVGISMDGPKKHHDKYRVFHNGKGSHDKVMTAIERGKKYGFNSILSVVNLDISPEEFYDELKNLDVQNFNLLLPDGHYDNLPNGFLSDKVNTIDHTPYADWLIEVFKIWKADTNRPMIRFFRTLIELIMGEQIGDQMLGTLTNGVAVLETNGALEVSDSIRACYEGITRNNLNIFNNNIEDLHDDPLFDVYFNSHSMLNEKCINCLLSNICGGGFLGNRYSNDNGFDNPTIYCYDTIKLVSFIQNDILSSLPNDISNSLEIHSLDYAEMVHEINNSTSSKIDKNIKNKLNSFKSNVKERNITC